MNVYLYNIPQTITEQSLSLELSKLPEWRRRKALSYHNLTDRFLCAKSYLLLAHALRENFQIYEEMYFDINENGKPYLRKFPHIHFNISHCNKGVLCVIHEKEVGCDIEEIPSTLDIDLCRYCFNEKEFKHITDSQNPCLEFTKLWTKKEACLKQTGKGLTDNLSDLFTDRFQNEFIFDTKVNFEHGYVYTVCEKK